MYADGLTIVAAAAAKEAVVLLGSLLNLDSAWMSHVRRKGTTVVCLLKDSCKPYATNKAWGGWFRTVRVDGDQLLVSAGRTSSAPSKRLHWLGSAWREAGPGNTSDKRREPNRPSRRIDRGQSALLVETVHWGRPLSDQAQVFPLVCAKRIRVWRAD
ncbi:uncharacterized protein B0I36DRAFT_429048 [Microdochium trichocladiopsis]|uniref:Uncharacterized protein n=1 Tax=Microdochium trichocladiopsis TaxID=1682393 RepID=A0A9P8YB80_9PEZI|nr:uncharacterized protein B0I36DRAFT_429048 [Microdochium trichocladiopsis]KAH7034765.1 hypothetical protein B0I36DRAFT_429048 [Microdochium trichocladiopsis]